MDNASPAASVLPNSSIRWWREREFLLLMLLVLGVYFTRPLGLTLRGEETRRGRIAYEMLANDDWLVPRMQGQMWCSRPPLHYWTIAAVGQLRGTVDGLAVRLPSLVATLLTALLVYAYGRTFLSATGALAAGCAYATMGQVLQLGSRGETEAVFTLLMSASLLVWHAGYFHRWPAAWTWIAACALAGLATLAKGPQAPVYFFGSVGVFLLVRKDWRAAIRPAAFAGLATFLLVVAAWHLPFYWRAGFEGLTMIYVGEPGKRFLENDLWSVLGHLVWFPLDLAGCMAPWSLLLLPYLSRRFRSSLIAAGPQVRFLAYCLAVAFPPVWLPPNSNTRYFMPLYPCLAVLVGLVIEQALHAQPEAQRVWSWFLRLMCLTMAAAVVVVAVLSMGQLTIWSQPAGAAVLFIAVVGCGAWLLWRAIQSQHASWGRSAVVAVTTFLGLSYNLITVNALREKAVDAVGEVAELRRKLPPNTKLVSFGLVSHLFLFHYEDDVELLPWPEQAADVPHDVEYFCINVVRNVHPPLPFAWEPVATVNCDRTLRAEPIEWIVIGRRVRMAETSSETTRR